MVNENSIGRDIKIINMDNAGEPDDNWFINQEIEILDRPFAGLKGVIYFIDREKRIVRVKIMFLWGRETPVQLNYSQMKPLK